MASWLGSCGVWPTVRKGMERLAETRAYREALDIFTSQSSVAQGRSSRVPSQLLNSDTHKLQGTRLLHCNGVPDRLQARHRSEGWACGDFMVVSGPPTRGSPLARFLAEGVSLIFYSWPRRPPYTPNSSFHQNPPAPNTAAQSPLPPSYDRAGYPRRGSASLLLLPKRKRASTTLAAVVSLLCCPVPFSSLLLRCFNTLPHHPRVHTFCLSSRLCDDAFGCSRMRRLSGTECK